MSLDELLSFHEDSERVLVFLGLLGENYDNRLGGFGYAWTLFGLPLALVLGAWFAWRFFYIFRMQKKLFWLLILSGVVFLSGSVLMENFQVFIKDSFQLERPVKILLLMEEMLEMLGVSLAVVVFFLYSRQVRNVETKEASDT